MSYQPPTPVTLSITSNTTLSTLNGDFQVLQVDSSAVPITVTLYALSAVLSGNEVVVRKLYAGNTVTINAGAATIDGQATVVMTGEGETLHLVTNGTTWTVTEATNRTGKTSETFRAGAVITTGNATVGGDLSVTGTGTFTTPLADSNLATISTGGKVANSATTATANNTASAIVARDASSNFSIGTGTMTGNITGNAGTATKLAASQTFALTGDVTGSASSDLTSGVSISTTLGGSVTAGKATNLAGGGSYFPAVPYQSAANTTAFVDANGISAGAVLTYNGANLAPTWQLLSTVSASANNITTGVAGDLLYQSSSGVTAKLAIGTNGQVLISNGSVPTWGTLASVANLSGGASNRIPYQTGAGATSYIAAPTTTNQFLRWNGSGFEWSIVSSTASAADKLSSARDFALTGAVTGTVSTDLTLGMTIATTIPNDSIALGTKTTGNYVASVAVSGTGLSVSGSGEGAAVTVTSNATSANTGSTLVARDASGNFSAGTITAALTGNASTATALSSARTFALTGDVAGSVSSTLAAGASIAATLANSGVSAGTYGGNNSIPTITVDAKGRVTAASATTPSGSYSISITGSAASVANALSFSGGGSYNGSSAVSINYASVGAPSTTGVGASGSSWGISITGSAASATTATTATNVASTSIITPSNVRGNVQSNWPVWTGSTFILQPEDVNGSITAASPARVQKLVDNPVAGQPTTLSGVIDTGGFVEGTEFYLFNDTGGDVTIKHLSAPSPYQNFATPNGGDYTFKSGATVLIVAVYSAFGGINVFSVVTPTNNNT